VPPHVGGTREKWGGTSKIFPPALRAGIVPPHLQIASDATGVRGRPWGTFFGLYKTRHILLSDSANCTVLRAVVLTKYRRVTDGQTDRRNCRS